MEGTGELSRFLADHRIHHQQHFIRLHCGSDPHHLLHHLGVDLQASGGVHKQRVEAFLLRLGQTCRRNLFRLGISPEAEYLHTDLPTQGLQLIDGSRTVDISTHHQRPAAQILEMETKLGGRSGLTSTLQTGHQHDRGSLIGVGERRVVTAHHLNQLIVHHLDELLVGTDPTHDLSTDGLVPDLSNKVLDDRKAHVCFQQGATHILERPFDIGVADLVLASQPLDRIFKAG